MLPSFNTTPTPNNQAITIPPISLEAAHTPPYTIVGLTTRVESSDNEESLGEDASKQRRIDAINADEEITLVSVQNVDEEMFDVNVLDVSDAGNVVSIAGDATTVRAATITTATITTVDDITLAQALMEIKSTKPKEKGVVIQELVGKLKIEIEAICWLKNHKWGGLISGKDDDDDQLAKRIAMLKKQEGCLLKKRLHYFNTLKEMKESILQLKE
ncbi:hypothetical protein Tco_0266659 [Tanacetum coccineum]